MKTDSLNAEAVKTATGPMIAADLAAPSSRTCSPFSTVTEAVLIFKEDDSDMVPVIDEGKPVGLVTDRDVALAVVDYPDVGAVPVSKIMGRKLALIPRDAPFDQVIKSMVTEGAHGLFVVDANGLLEGVINWSDLALRVPIGQMSGMFEECNPDEVDSL
jgi:predicted transcriptional regulator